jgi:dihydroxy-acid dehydratase
MGMASRVVFAIDGMNLGPDVAFVTDGQLSGLCLKGLTVAEVHPEAATGGPIGKIRDGDIITISVKNRSIDVDVPADELSRRNGPGYLTPASGYLDTFRHDVRDMATGGVLVPAKE